MFKHQYKQVINMDGDFLCMQKPAYCYSIIICTFSHRVFSQHLKSETYMVASHHIVPCLQRCLPSVVTSNAVHD